jgi:streptomycin 6-kinase
LPNGLITTLSKWSQHELTPGWISSLPATVEHLCARWDIELDPTIPETYVTLVLLGHSSELGPVVIKSSPLAGEFRAEATALRLAAGVNVCRVYDVDFDRSAMVLERIVPGTHLHSVPMTDEAATRLAAETVYSFWRPVSDPEGLHPLRQWMGALLEWSPRPTVIPADLISQAQDVAEALLANSTRSCLLHGDFQHHNLLQRASGDWAMIDPKGLVGDPGFDIGAWMYNPPGVTEGGGYRERAARRIAICADVWGLPQEDLAGWAFLAATLNACWSGAMIMELFGQSRSGGLAWRSSRRGGTG